MCIVFGLIVVWHFVVKYTNSSSDSNNSSNGSGDNVQYMF